MELIHDIEELLGKKLEEYEVDEDKVLKGITKVSFSPRIYAFGLRSEVSTLKMSQVLFALSCKARLIRLFLFLC